MSDELEPRLRALQPAAPPADLLRRLLAAAPPSPGKIRWLPFALPLSAAAALALAFGLHRAPVPAAPAAPSAARPSDFHVFLPIAHTSTLIEVRDVALIDREPARPYRLVRATWLDDTTYAGDDGHSKLRRREPRSELLHIALETL